MREIILTAADANRRLDKYLAQYLNNAPRSLLYKLLRKKRIKLNGCRADGSEITMPGDRVTLYLSDDTLAGCMAERTVAVSAGLPDRVYEDGHILLINKPAGLLAHAAGQGSADTLIARVLYYLQQTGAYDDSRYATFTPALCNRLDRNTSGLIVCGKTLAAVQQFNRLFAERHVEKTYLAVVQGILNGQGTLTGYLHKDEKSNTVRVLKTPTPVHQSALPVETYYEAIRQGEAHTLLRVKPLTGRSHQIRAHLSGIGHPIAGDIKYGGSPTPYAPAQLLHCCRLALTRPADGLPYAKGQAWQASLPEGLAACLRDWFEMKGDVLTSL